MKKPAVHLVVWLFAFFALFFTLDRILGTAASSLYERTEVGEGTGHGHYSSMQTSAEFVALGSSRARNHIDTSVIEEVTGLRSYNAGANGQGLYYARAMQLALQAKGSDLRLLLVNLSPIDLYEADTGRTVVLLPLATLSPELKALFTAMDPWFRLKSASILYRYNAMLLPMFLNRGLKADVKARGFYPREGTMRHDDFFGEEAMENQASPSSVPSPTSVALLDAMVADARHHEYTLVLFTAPYFEGNRDWPADSATIVKERASAAWLQSYANSNDVRYISFNDERWSRVDDDNAFRDTIHLRPWVTTEFTEELIKRLQPELNSLKQQNN